MCALVGVGCAASDEELDPTHYPGQLHQVDEDGPVEYVDLDGDGTDERILYHDPETPAISREGRASLILRTLNNRTIDQVNFSGALGRLHFADFEDDGRLEILVPVVRSDSLFLHVVDSQGRKQGRFFVTTGTPRVEPEGTMPWDPNVSDVFLSDVNGDGSPELVTLANTYYAQLPRGVWVHDLEQGVLLGEQVIGAAIRRGFVEDVDDDPYPELVFSTGSPNNGAVAGGMDDQHAYIAAFELSVAPRVQWKREMGGLWTNARLTVGDLDGDGDQEFVAYTWTNYSRPDPTRLQLIDPATGETIRQTTFGVPLRSAITANLDRDAQDEIITLDRSGRVRVLNGRLQVVRDTQVDEQARGMKTLPDADGDGVEELILGTPQGTFFFDRDFRVKAVSSSRGRWGVIRRGAGQRPLLHAGTMNDGRMAIFRMVDNPYYLVYRYGPWGAGVVGFALLLGLGVFGRRVARRRRKQASKMDQVLESDTRGTLLLRPDATIEDVNEAARRVLALSGRPITGRVLREAAPQLADVVEDALSQPARTHQHTVVLGDNGASTACRVTLTPALNQDGSVGRWVMRIEETELEGALDEYRAWGIMARRLAHDLKNPLTGILMTLQHLQMEYEEVAPTATDELDPYVGRIEDRVEHLRRMTTNFLKFVNLEDPLLVATDLNQFTRERMQVARTDIPSDIELHLKLEGGLPPVRLDPDQMTSVLENLVANAVEAMPEGGRLTIVTYPVQDVQWDADSAPTDYVVLEVRDTGEGMGDAVQARLFEPGFTTAEDGTGLGLAIVRKVIDDHGGHIDVESAPGDGSVFGMYLPTDADRAASNGAERPARGTETSQ
jgi:signal transduction histidine kinase